MTKQTYFTSDWHLHHKNVITFNNRPFRDVNHMHEVLIANYNATVGKNDLCYFLGDVGFCSTDKLTPIINRLNGTKVLLLGNHDKKSRAYENAGFDVVILNATIKIGNEVVTMSHYPLYGVSREDTTKMRGIQKGDNWHKEQYYHSKGYVVENKGQFHLHGHLHCSKDRSPVKEGKQWDVGVDGNKYTPVSIKNVESWIALTKE